MRIILSILAICLVMAFKPAKRKITADPASSYIRYSMQHPLHDWDAKSPSSRCVVVYDDESSKIEAVAVVVPVKSFDSGNANRDSHAIEVLEALRFPNITFSSTGITEEGGKLSVKGNLNFHGVSRPVVFTAVRKSEKEGTSVSGSFVINMKDYNIEPPGLMGVKTKEEIKLDFVMSFKI